MLKRCPKCRHFSVTFDYQRGEELCLWSDCNWVNSDRQRLEEADVTNLTVYWRARVASHSVISPALD